MRALSRNAIFRPAKKEGAILSRVENAVSPRSFVFESEWNSRFAIFCQQTSGDLPSEPLIASERHCLFAAPSPCGRYIAFTETDSTSRIAASSVRLFDRRDRSITTIAEEGTFPSFSQDGSCIYFEHHRSSILRVNLKSGEVETIFAPQDTGFGDFQISKPSMSADGRYVFVTSDRGGRWNVWRVCRKSDEVVHVGKGCEPVSLQNGEAVLWVSPKGIHGTEICIRDFQTNSIEKVLPEHSGRFQYYPSVDPTERWLLCSVSKPYSFLRHTATYALLAVEIASGRLTKLPRLAASSRWGRWLTESSFAVYYFLEFAEVF